METTILNFTLTFEEANTIIAGLQELPAKIANPLTQKLQQQARDQIQAAKEAEQSSPNLEVVK
jgi:outer membrane murein-binding lipoprotein Lpp